MILAFQGFLRFPAHPTPPVPTDCGSVSEHTVGCPVSLSIKVSLVCTVGVKLLSLTLGPSCLTRTAPPNPPDHCRPLATTACQYRPVCLYPVPLARPLFFPHLSPIGHPPSPSVPNSGLLCDLFGPCLLSLLYFNAELTIAHFFILCSPLLNFWSSSTLVVSQMPRLP